MTDASTIALQQIIAQLGAIVDRLSVKTTYQDNAEESLDKFKKRREDVKRDTSKKQPVAEYLKKLLDLQSTPTLASGESTRYQNIAKIFNKILNVDAISKSIDLLRKSNEEAAEQQRRQALLGRTTAAKVAVEKAKPVDAKTSFSMGDLASLGAIAAALAALNKFLKSGPGKLGPLTGMVDLLTKWTAVGILKNIGLFFKSITAPLSLFIKTITGKSIGENILSSLKGVADVILKTASKAASFIGEKFANLGAYLSRFFPRIMSNVSSITSIFTQTFKAVGEKIGEVGAGKGLLGRIFKGVLGPLAKITSKAGLKLLTTVPGIGALISFYFAYDRYKSGDVTGSLIEVAAGLANLIPVPFLGSALSFGISMINAFRDVAGVTPAIAAEGEQGWFSQALESISKTINENCYNWPVLGPMIRVVQHLKEGNYIDALNSIAHIVPPVGWILDLMGFTESPTQDRPVSSFTSETINGMVDFLKNILMSIPGVGNVLRSLEHFMSGNFEAGFAEILPQSVMSLYKKFRGSKTDNINIKQETQGVNATQASQAAQAIAESKTPSILPTQTTQSQISEPVTRVEMSGIKDLHNAMLQMNQTEINILTEQRNLLNDSKSLLRTISDQLRMMSTDSQSQIMQPTPSLNTREELSSTRKRYLENKNVFGASLT